MYSWLNNTSKWWFSNCGTCYRDVLIFYILITVAISVEMMATCWGFLLHAMQEIVTSSLILAIDCIHIVTTKNATQGNYTKILFPSDIIRFVYVSTHVMTSSSRSVRLYISETAEWVMSHTHTHTYSNDRVKQVQLISVWPCSALLSPLCQHTAAVQMNERAVFLKSPLGNPTMQKMGVNMWACCSVSTSLHGQTLPSLF